MLNLTEVYLPSLQAQKNTQLELGSSATYPSYDGQSLLNLPSSLCEWFNVPTLPHSALNPKELGGLAEGVRQIILVLIDAVSHHRFQRWLEGTNIEFQIGIENAYLLPLTSVVPSTTCSVLTTLWTGRSPAEHGILGYELFLKEYGLIANMITHSPASFEGRAGLLDQAGFDPETALPVPTLGTHLSNAGVETHAFLAKSILGSGLSRMHYPSVAVHGFRTITDLWIQARELTEIKSSSPRLTWIYYGAVDNYSHIYGPDSEQAEIEFINFLNLLQGVFLSNLTADARKGTLVLIIADHGQLPTPQDPQYDLSNHQAFLDHLHMLPTGENRLAYLHPKPGRSDAIREYVELTWPGKFRFISAAKALDSGLFGPGRPCDEALSRLGDWILVPQDDAYLWWSSKPNHLLGRHGGVSEQEMVVPLLALRLG